MTRRSAVRHRLTRLSNLTPRRLGFLAALPMAAYALFSVLIVAWIVSISLKTNPELFSSTSWSLPSSPQFGNYVEAWNSGIGRSLLNSVLLTTTTVVVAVGISAAAAYALGRIAFRGSGFVYVLLLSGLALPSFLVVVPLYFLLRDLQLLGSLVGLGLVYVATIIPFNIYVLTPYFRSLPRELEEAAYLDGAGPARTFYSVMLPLALPGLAAAATLNVLTIWNEFFFALVFLTDRASYTVGVGIFQLSFTATYAEKWVQLAAGAIMVMLPVLVVFAIAQRTVDRTLTGGALK